MLDRAERMTRTCESMTPTPPPTPNKAGNDNIAFVQWKIEFPSKADGFGVDRILPLARKMCQGRGIDIGGAADGRIKESPIPGAEIIDPSIGTGTSSKLPHEDGVLDYVFSSHALEHTIEVERSVKEAFRVLKSGGVYFLYLPHESHLTWNPRTNPDVRHVHRWQPDYNGIGRLMLFVGFLPIYLEPKPDVHFGWLAIARKP